MNAKFFLDSNIVAYSFDENAPQKASISRTILHRNDWAVSWQVIQEFTSVALYKFEPRLEPEDIAEYSEIMLWPQCKVFPSPAIHRSALNVLKNTQYRYYNCLIIASAINAGAAILYSEDMQHGHKIGGIEIRNPFL